MTTTALGQRRVGQEPRFTPTEARSICLMLCGFLIGSVASAGTPPMTPAWIEHQGTEHIIAGPNVPDAQGLPTDPAYEAHQVALSEDGSRIWFSFDDWNNPSSEPEYQLWTMLTDGTAERRVIATDDNWVETAVSSGNLWIETSASGDLAVTSSSQKFSLIELPPGPGDPVAVLIADLDPYRRASSGFRVSDDGTTVVFADNWNEVVASLDLTAGGGVVTAPTIVADRNQLSREGNQPTGLRSFDMSASGSDWWTFAWDSWSGSDHYWLNHGQGLGPTSVSHETLPLGDTVWSDWFEASDDGSVMAYCLDYDSTLNNPQGCWIHEPGTSAWIRIEGDQGNLGVPVLADGGTILYVTDQWNQGTSYGYRVWTENPSRRKVAGSQRLADSAWPEFSQVALSNDGRILAAPTTLGIYVQRDGHAVPTGFPAIESISSGYDSGTDELVVEVTLRVDSASLERIFTLPLYGGIEPSRRLAEIDNPLYTERNGGGVNASTVFTEMGGGVWERRIAMEGKYGLLTSEFALRIVAVDVSGHRTAYYDFRPTLLFGDGFESGDATAWSASLR